jgi:hypothetical protein
MEHACEMNIEYVDLEIRRNAEVMFKRVVLGLFE